MKYVFRWNDWNQDHLSEHGVFPSEAEEVVVRARRPYPRKLGDRKYSVHGQTEDGYYLQVIFVFDPEGTIYILHARPLTEAEKRRLRRERR